ncbi:MAG TPA: DUF6119 family protein [Streptomyces sp.]|nr:DUF6119 family protein [Streptomyces sp.]
MVMKRERPPSARKTSLYRLRTPEGTELDLRIFVADHYVGREDYTAQEFDHAGLKGLLVTGTVNRGRASWCAAVESLTGIAVDVENRTSSGLLLVRAEKAVYALTYGLGHHMVNPFYLDSGFGLEFAVRCLDKDGVTLVRRHLMDARGRTDENSITRGDSIHRFGIESVGAIVSRITGVVPELPLSHVRKGGRAVRVVSSDSSIKLPLACEPEKFLSDLRAVESICARPEPLPDFEFVARVRALRRKNEVVERLDGKLDELLAAPAVPRLALSAPSECLENYGAAESFKITGGGRSKQVGELELGDLLGFVSGAPPGSRLSGLGEVRVQMFSDAEGKEPLSGRVSGRRWITADVPMGSGRYFYWQGGWYEIGAEYLTSIDAELKELLDRPASIELPPWPEGMDEGSYNKEAAEETGYALFDTKNVHTEKFRGGGLEICDLLGPQGQLIHVKKADKSTADLNHLFAQGRAAVETLRLDRKVREKFLARVSEAHSGRRAEEVMDNLTVVFAILLKGGIPITVESFFAFAQVSLLQTARELQAMGARVEVVAIRR